MVFSLLVLTTLLSLTASENLSCSDKDSKDLVSQVMRDNYSPVFGQAAYAVDTESLEVAPSEITTIVSEPRHATCEAAINFTAQPRRVEDAKSQETINQIFILFGRTRTAHASYELRRTDDGDLTVKVTDLQ